MRRVPPLVALALLALACEGRELAIFELMSGGNGGTGGNGGASAGAADTAGAGGLGSATTLGAGTGGQAGAGGSGGAAGMPMYDGGMGGGPMMPMPPKPCTEDNDCSPGWLCEKMGCDATDGFCAPWPAFCPPDPKPVCGCDGVTYWNDCIRLQSHARFAMPDQCRQTACSCEVAGDCNVPYASCSHLLPPGAMCGPGMGACWVLPPECPKNVDSKMWHECKPPDSGPAACVDTCTAIASEKPFVELHRGDTCM